jgi:hypothetical protein
VLKLVKYVPFESLLNLAIHLTNNLILSILFAHICNLAVFATALQIILRVHET